MFYQNCTEIWKSWKQKSVLLINISKRFVIRLPFQIFSLFGCMCCWAFVCLSVGLRIHRTEQWVEFISLSLFINAVSLVYFFVFCLPLSVKRQETRLHLTVSALKMGLFPYSAHSASRRKTAVAEDRRFCCHFTPKAECQDGVVYVRVINSSHNGFLSWFTAKLETPV